MLWTCSGSIQFSYTSSSKYKCSSPSRNLMSCSLLISWLCSLSYLSYGDVICGIHYFYALSCFFSGDVICGTSCFYSLNFLSCGDVICDTCAVYLATCTIVGTTRTIVGITNGSTLPFIIFFAFTFVLSYSLFTLEFKAPPSSTMFFFLRTRLGEFATTFYLFSSVFYISCLVV